MRGSDMMQRLIAAGEAAYFWRGKPMRRQPLDRLNAIRRQLETNPHLDTPGAALRELATMLLDAQSAAPRPSQRLTPRTPQQSAQRTAQERRRADDVALYFTVKRRAR